MSEPQPIGPVAKELAKALKKMKPKSEAEFEQHVFDTFVCEFLERSGFEARFRRRYEFKGSQKQTSQTVKRKLKSNGAIVALIGNRGVGKTTIAAEFAQSIAFNNYYFDRRDYVSYRKAIAIVSKFKPLFSNFGSIHTEDLTQQLARYCSENEYCIIDEIHDAQELDVTRRIITDIVDRRYAARRDTILISNHATQEAFAEAIGDSIASRINEHGMVIPCNWKSFREVKP